MLHAYYNFVRRESVYPSRVGPVCLYLFPIRTQENLTNKLRARLQQMRYTYFYSQYEPTIEDMYKDSARFGGKIFHLKVVDTGGKHEYDDVRKRCYKTADAFMLVFSIDNKASFNALYDIHDEIIHRLSQKQKKKVSFLLVGNKSDVAMREVTLSEGRTMASHFACDFVEVSARRGEGVQACFEKVMGQHSRRNERRKSDLDDSDEDEHGGEGETRSGSSGDDDAKRSGVRGSTRRKGPGRKESCLVS